MKNHTIKISLFLLLLSMTGCGQAKNSSPLTITSPTPSSSISSTSDQTAFTPASPPLVASTAVINGTSLSELEKISLENANRLVPLKTIGEGDFGDEIVISPDGQLLAVAADGGVILLDTTSGERAGFLPTPGRVASLDFSPDGTQIAEVYRVKTGETTQNVYQGEISVVEPLLTVHRVSDQELVLTKRLAESGCADSIAWNVRYSPDGQVLAIRGISGMYANDTGNPSQYTICLLSASDGSLIRSIPIVSSTSNRSPLIFTRGGQRLLATVHDGHGEATLVQAYDVTSGQVMQTYEGQVGEISDMTLSSDEEWLALAGWQGVTLLSVNDGSLIATLNNPEHTFRSLAFSPDGKTLALGSGDGHASLWRIPEGTMIWEKPAVPLMNLMAGDQQPYISDLVFSPGGEKLFCLNQSHWGYTTGIVQTLQMVDGRELYRVFGRNSIVTPRLSPDASLVAFAGYEDGRVQLWSVAGNHMVGVLKGHTGMVAEAIFSPDGSQIATASLDGTVRLWKVEDGALTHTISGHSGAVWRVQYSFDGTLLASAGEDATLHLWDPSDGSHLKTLPTQTGEWWMNTLVFALDGKSVLLASGCNWMTCPASGAGDLRRIDLENGQIETLLAYPISEISFSADQTQVGISSGQGKQSGNLLTRQFRGYSSPQGFLSGGAGLSLDGNLFFSGNHYSLHAWDVATGALIAIVPEINAVSATGHTSVSLDQRLVAIAGQDGLLSLWGVHTNQ